MRKFSVYCLLSSILGSLVAGMRVLLTEMLRFRGPLTEFEATAAENVVRKMNELHQVAVLALLLQTIFHRALHGGS
jgi:hypothetical protein